MADLKDYTLVIGLLVEEKYKIFGRLAIDKANTVGGLTVDDDGNVSPLEADSKTVFHQLLAVYEKIDGKTSSLFVAQMGPPVLS